MKNTFNLNLFPPPRMLRRASFILIILFTVHSCKEEPVTPQPETNLLLSVEDVSCTEAWVKLTTTNLQVPASLDLLKDDNIIKTINLQTADTLLYIDSLLPNQTYKFQSVIQSINHSSNEVSVATMDTTSHNFTWQQFTFGEHNPSTLRDVAIIDENNIIAVGEIFLNNDVQPYCYMMWDGEQWKLGKLKYFPPGAIGDSIPTTAYSVFAFNINDIWLSGGAIFHWNGSNWKIFYNTGAEGANKIWGTSRNDLYFVGGVGRVVHYNGSRWTNLVSGTDLDLLDVWGSPDGSVVWTCGYYRDKHGTYLLRSTGGNFEMAYDGTANEFKILQDTISGAMTSVYTPNMERIFIGSSAGVYSASSSTRGEGKRLSFTPTFFPGFPNKLTGNGVNDLTIVGDYSFIGHYNGYSWKYFDEFYSEDIRFWSAAIKNEIIVAVGRRRVSPIYGQALIYLGRR